jgi:heme/copper-type cytochrome/quinol oxidase subunit 1
MITDAYMVTLHGVLAAFFWAIVGAGATAAVYSKRIRDTTWERVALSGVAIMAFATSCRVIRAGLVSEGSLLLSGFLALYVVAVVAKHLRKHPPTTPRDKSERMPLEPFR